MGLVSSRPVGASRRGRAYEINFQFSKRAAPPDTQSMSELRARRCFESCLSGDMLHNSGRGRLDQV